MYRAQFSGGSAFPVVLQTMSTGPTSAKEGSTCNFTNTLAGVVTTNVGFSKIEHWVLYSKSLNHLVLEFPFSMPHRMQSTNNVCVNLQMP